MNDEWTPMLVDDPAPPEPDSAVLARVVRRGRQRSVRRRAIFGATSAAVVVVLVGSGLAVANSKAHGSRVHIETPKPTPSTTLPGAVPVWYDARGLHHGDVVEQTPVEIGQQLNGAMGNGALALVRSGAVYLDPATGDVWFHPWGGEPRIVGRNSSAGPGGDPNGDTAAWFEGSELVVYDTAAGREISRTDQQHSVGFLIGDHHPAGNTFLQVSAERVVWLGTQGVFSPSEETYMVYSHDLRTGTTSVLRDSPLDVHGHVEVLASPGSDWVLRAPGRAEKHYPELENRARLSPSGNYALAVENPAGGGRHAAAIVDTRTGELWPVPRNAYPWIAWSYGDIALVDTNEGPNSVLLACDAARRTCERLHAERPILMPTN
jgi:hypothetical protein